MGESQNTCQPSSLTHFYKARTVPFALRDKVETNLDRLLKLDIIEPVRFSIWAAPIVPLPKGDNTI